MNFTEKVEDLRQYLAERFPAPDFNIEVLVPAPYEYVFNITCPADLLGKSRRLGISEEALDDLDTYHITSFLDLLGTEKRWLEYRDRPFRLDYEAAVGLTLPIDP